MKKYKRTILVTLAALLVLAGVVDAAGGKLAQPEYQGPENDTWIGYFLSWEYFPGEGEVIHQDRTDWVEYGSQNLNVSGLDSVRIPREILIGQYQDGKGFTFPGLEGYCAFLAQVEQEDGSVVLSGNQLMDAKTNVGDTKNSVSGTIYYGLPLGKTEWTENGSEYIWTAYDVYQMPDGTVYLDGSGNSYGGAGGMTIKGEQTSTETINGETNSVTMSAEVRFETVSRLQEVRVKQFDASDQVIEETAFSADALEDETAVTLAKDTGWLVVEEHCTDGTVTRTVYDAQQITWMEELYHSLVVLDDEGMGSSCTLSLKSGTQGTAAA